MPGGIPVATVSIGKAGAKNAALLAISILSLKDENLRGKLKKYREDMAQQIEKQDRDLNPQ
jgi:5-(carboxyamino)imidazole ribonucleotide mutase